MAPQTMAHNGPNFDRQTQIDRHTYRQTYRKRDIQTERHTDRETYRQRDIQTERHTDR